MSVVADARIRLRELLTWPRCFAGGLLLALVAPALLANSYQVNILVLVLVFVLLAVSLDILLGFMGYLSLGHHGLWAIGAYASAILATRAGWGFWPSLLAAGGFTAAFAAVVAVPAFRVRGHYFALVTLAMGELVRIVILNWVSLTEGPFGITEIPPPRVPGVGAIDGRTEYYYLTLAVTVVVLLGVVRLLRSPAGRCLRAIREDEDLAEAQGLHLIHYKIAAFAVSGFIAGLAGSLFAHYQGVIGPDNFTIQFMAEMLVMVIVGGSGLIAGSVLGPLVFVPLPEISRAVGEARLLIFGLLLILIVIWAPDGVAGRINDWLARDERKGEN